MKSLLKSSLAIVALVSLAGCAGDADTDGTSSTVMTDVTTTTVAATVKITVTVGKDSGPTRTETVALGASVEITLVNPNAADNFHLHGYDIESGDTKAGTPAVISFTADKAGEFEIESHVTEEVLAVIQVG